MKKLFAIASLLLTCAAAQAQTVPAKPANGANALVPVGKGDVRIYLAEDESAKRVLESLLSFYGLKLVGDAVPTRPISGRFEVRNVDDVMSYFRSAYRLNWFQNGTNIYVYRSSDWRTKRVYVGGERSNDEWKEFLTSSGLFYKDFPFVFSPDARELVVSGPASYINLVENAFSVAPPDPSEVEKHGISLMTYPLKHASVEDRQTILRGSVVVTPGVLTVLLNLLDLPAQPVATTPEAKARGKVNNKGGLNASGYGETTERFNVLPGSPTPGIPKTTQNEVDPQSRVPTVTADPRTNSILIRDAKSKYNYYRDLIAQLDKPLAMMEVEAMMVEVDQTGLQELGLEFGLLSRHFAYDFPGPAGSNASVLARAEDSGIGPGRYPGGYIPGASSVVDPTRFMARLRALAADENAKVLARPTILTQDNVSAFIDLSQTLYLPVTGERVANIEQVTAGSLLQVTPRLVEEDGESRIFLRIEIQDGSLLTDEVIGFNRAARVQNTSLSTQAVIQRDKAILIGGYNRESVDSREYRVPLLSSIPFVGKAFTSTEKTNRNVARLFLIVPKLVDRPLHDMQSARQSVETVRRNFKVDGAYMEPTPTLRLDPSIGR